MFRRFFFDFFLGRLFFFNSFNGIDDHIGNTMNWAPRLCISVEVDMAGERCGGSFLVRVVSRLRSFFRCSKKSLLQIFFYVKHLWSVGTMHQFYDLKWIP